MNRCVRLTSLTFDSFAVYTSAAFKTAPLLRRIYILSKFSSRMAVKTIETISNNCPLLEVLVFKTFASENVVLGLFTKCPLLADVCMHYSFTFEILHNVARNMNSVVLGQPENHCTVKKTAVRGKQCLLFTSNDWYSHGTLLTMFGLNPSMTTLCLDFPTGCSGDTMEALVNSCPLLTSLRILHCREIGANSLQHIAQFKHLVSLELRDMRRMTNTMIYELLRDKPHFLKLALPHCGGITGGILRTIARYCQLIRYVDVSYCEEVKSSDVIILLTGCYMLYHLNLKNCKAVTSDILSSIKCSQMKYLNVFGCNILKETMMKFVSLADFRPTCQLFY